MIPRKGSWIQRTILNSSDHNKRLKMTLILRKESWIQRITLNSDERILILSKLRYILIFFLIKVMEMSNNNKNLSTWERTCKQKSLLFS